MSGLRTFFSRYWGVLGILLLWQAWVSISGLNAIVLPSPFSVASDLVANPAIYAGNAGKTFLVAVLGLAFGLLTGVLLSLAAWASRLLNGLLTPLGLIFSSIPVVALIPILARLLGYDMRTEVAIVAIAAFFPTFVFVGAGLKSLPPGSDDLFKVLGASPWQRFLRLVMPAAVPNMMVALRLTAPEAVLAAILAELLMGTSGLGFMFREAAGRLAMERAFGTSIIATITAVIVFGLVMSAERRIDALWR
ncbi:MAG: ABC transporter permease subunit [Candidatus Devosia phytovorans]|uniref:ABC transporter permease subunit n=1 Tax=Candidatus Devosia phytovorans TaxID=3121372 RepID=A0AAJ5VYK0_9HYPH|nr:ABC transporter permease subunit [Devosia sp.]WEK06550.1 MAG: ABC transporter permease subunit [Devosia sp.]